MVQRIVSMIKNAAARKWVFFGDSITQGYQFTNGGRWFSELFTEQLKVGMRRYNDVIINTGIAGNTTNDLLLGVDWRVAHFKPDVVFLMIGMNDCAHGSVALTDFEANLQKLIGLIRDVGALPVMQTTSTLIKGQAPGREENFPIFMNTVRCLAAKNELPIVDHTAYWDANQERTHLWMANAYHPNEFGHRVLAEEIYKATGLDHPLAPIDRPSFPMS